MRQISSGGVSAASVPRGSNPRCSKDNRGGVHPAAQGLIVDAELAADLDVLRALIASAPSQATNGLQQAIDEAKQASHAAPKDPASNPPTATPRAHPSTAPSHRPDS